MRLFNSKQEELETPYSFQDRFKNIQRIAIVYPQKHEHLRIARYAMQNLYNLPERFEFLIMQSAEASRFALGIEFQLGEMNYEPTKTDRERLLNRFVAFNPDILLQLEPEPDDRLIKLLKSVPIGLKIGFGPEDSGLNIIYSQKKTGFYEKNILNLIALIRAD
jgi:hypothetical protein